MDLYFSQRESEGDGNFCAVLVIYIYRFLFVVDLLYEGALLLLVPLSTTKKAKLSHVLHVVKVSNN